MLSRLPRTPFGRALFQNVFALGFRNGIPLTDRTIEIWDFDLRLIPLERQSDGEFYVFLYERVASQNLRERHCHVPYELYVQR